MKISMGMKFFILGLISVILSIFGIAYQASITRETAAAPTTIPTPASPSVTEIPVIPFTFPNRLQLPTPTEPNNFSLFARARKTPKVIPTANIETITELWPKGRYRSLVFDEATAERDIVYKSTYHTTFSLNENLNYQLVDDTASPVDLKLNIYQPTADTQALRPLLIFVYGGGWIEGDRYQQEASALDYARRGYVTMTMDYTMMPPGNELNPVPDPDAMVYPRIIDKSSRNIYEVYQWALDHKDQYRIDTTRIGIGGWSAGGLISQALIHLNSFPTPYGVRAVLGQSNILPEVIFGAQPLGGARTFSNDFNPVSMFASYDDDTGFAGTPNDHAADCAYLDAIGHKCITITYSGSGHEMNFYEIPGQTDALDFFATHVTGY